uniref:Uncharacterized protein n=1 Tax=Klebsiella pneumoniae TaxID=573 RepID=A0A8B0SSR8_KLEPN|nr:hypothetical protein [Klebsiella pneumoniae]
MKNIPVQKNQLFFDFSLPLFGRNKIQLCEKYIDCTNGLKR